MQVRVRDGGGFVLRYRNWVVNLAVGLRNSSPCVSIPHCRTLAPRKMQRCDGVHSLAAPTAPHHPADLWVMVPLKSTSKLVVQVIHGGAESPAPRLQSKGGREESCERAAATSAR